MIRVQATKKASNDYSIVDKNFRTKLFSQICRKSHTLGLGTYILLHTISTIQNRS
jgi:hypothetical protein